MHGIIPARAGFTCYVYFTYNSQEDHPRSRGVYGRGIEPRCGLRGSSPLARGLRDGNTRRTRSIRIIPARAGFTTTVPVGGGYFVGSSPLARGLPSGSVEALGRGGIIPARAGFTGRRPADAGTPTDHPRSRGVYFSSPWKTLRSRGSSPLARGLRGWVVGGGGRCRIIPARAGFTGRCPPGVIADPDHPRSRGVYRMTRSG